MSKSIEIITEKPLQVSGFFMLFTPSLWEGWGGLKIGLANYK
jgi:hypothetical protein